MNIGQATFLTSAPELAECPETPLPEVAFIGRSNVGKSSLLNMLTNRKELAKTSSRPGKTELINYFAIPPKAGHLVDLPGYGYARKSKERRELFATLIADYIADRPQLQHVFVLVDAMIPPQALDLDFILWLADLGRPHTILFTKTDRLKKTPLQKNTERFAAALGEHYNPLPEMIVTSSKKGTGKSEILAVIREAFATGK
ncbi:ribosome biogenesis GTP-binding protein YihA/YsxC [Roseibacillus ishigakijimensis]|uniref:Probable GTP-binding protein EngB n=1 Tax=Roseibacillus ishigakijimensis TaxID=454146 RepID=A0A934VM96_9BACT|nr:ribosome biogenesis GTP-binding protein YihA/YsxC [Roseibacillus ishigakijimensis]MBK1833866.1 YihA family ribosome biogenesis GTP-binding protein [Roseibacillus ishigakijimensis]